MTEKKWIKERPARPSAEGWYKVMHPGSEILEGHVYYDYPDYSGWAYWQPATPAEFAILGSTIITKQAEEAHWICEHDEDGESIFAYYGPLDIPEFEE